MKIYKSITEIQRPDLTGQNLYIHENETSYLSTPNQNRVEYLNALNSRTLHAQNGVL